MKKKISLLQFLLSVLFVSALMISNVITSKQILLPYGLTMTSATLVFPITYVLSDLFSEVYGYKWSRITCYLAFAMNLFMVVVFSLALQMPYPSFWQNQEAFEIVLGSTPRILFASLSAFVFGDFVNDQVFKQLKNKYKDSHKGFSTRAILSSICGEVVDSSIFFPIAFSGAMPFEVMANAMLLQVIIKVSYEVIILPITNYIVLKVSNYEKRLVNENN